MPAEASDIPGSLAGSTQNRPSVVVISTRLIRSSLFMSEATGAGRTFIKRRPSVKLKGSSVFTSSNWTRGRCAHATNITFICATVCLAPPMFLVVGAQDGPKVILAAEKFGNIDGGLPEPG
jgi:hypothetical protein